METVIIYGSSNHKLSCRLIVGAKGLNHVRNRYSRAEDDLIPIRSIPSEGKVGRKREMAAKKTGRREGLTLNG